MICVPDVVRRADEGWICWPGGADGWKWNGVGARKQPWNWTASRSHFTCSMLGTVGCKVQRPSQPSLFLTGNLLLPQVDTSNAPARLAPPLVCTP